MSLPQIHKMVPVSKGTLSLWLRDIPLSEDQLKQMQDAHHERIGNAVRDSRKRRWAAYELEADKLWPVMSKDPEFMFGLALYAGEGSKSGGALGVTNCDQRILCKAIAFYESLGVPKMGIHARYHIHDAGLIPTASAFWIQALGITPLQLKNPVVAVSRASKRIRQKSQPNGTCVVLVHNTRLLRMVLRWITLALEGWSPPFPPPAR
jgi:hypothetical protein